MNDDNKKNITITGINNRYQIKKLINGNNSTNIKNRIATEKWDIPDEYLHYETQIKMVNDIILNCNNHFDNVSKIFLQQINSKMIGYRSQDSIKKMFNEDKFVKLENILQKMKECELKCRYCKTEMFVLYKISREMKQWSVDRINNEEGHNSNNYHLACLDCNLKRRKKTDEKFLFTKQLSIVKQDN